jgi:oligogalacturonide lyase
MTALQTRESPASPTLQPALQPSLPSPAGTRWPAEWSTSVDLETGATVRRLTNYKGHSHHLYFTNPGWHAGGTRLLFGSDRQNRTNLFSIDLTSGEIDQLTDLDMPPPPAETSFLFACVNRAREEAYFWHGRRLLAIDLETRALREIYVAPDGFLTNMLNCTADGRYVCTGLYEDLSDRFNVDLLHGYVGFREYHQAHPLSQVLRIATDGSGAEVVFEERNWIGHVNTSPAEPNLLTFCHEGPWQEVDNRIWGLDLSTGRTWKIRPREHVGERVGHEYWLADGLHVGYHGTTADGVSFFGAVRYDNTERVEARIEGHSTHFHSNGLDLVVGDGSARRNLPYVVLWRFHDGAFEGPRKLCLHRGSFHVQQLHVHPRFSPDDRQVLFTADPNGYGNLYLVDVPDFDSLPLATGSHA